MDEEENKQSEIEQNPETAETIEILEEEIVVEEQVGKKFVKKKRRERVVRRGRLKQERLRTVVRLFITLGIIVGFFYSWNLDGFYMSPDSFNKVGSPSVEIINNNIVPTHKILLLLKNNDVPSVPIFMARTNSIKKELMQLEPVEDVYIRRYAFPARLQIILRERTPFVTIAPDVKAPAVAFFTTDGKLIGKDFLPLNKSYKTILVLSYGNKGDDYRKWDLKKLKEIQKIVKYIETYSKESVEYVDFRNPNDVFVKINSVNIRVGKLDETIFKRIERLPSILPQVKQVKSKVKYLDLSWEEVNYLKLE